MAHGCDPCDSCLSLEAAAAPGGHNFIVLLPLCSSDWRGSDPIDQTSESPAINISPESASSREGNISSVIVASSVSVACNFKISSACCQ